MPARFVKCFFRDKASRLIAAGNPSNRPAHKDDVSARRVSRIAGKAVILISLAIVLLSGATFRPLCIARLHQRLAMGPDELLRDRIRHFPPGPVTWVILSCLQTVFDRGEDFRWRSGAAVRSLPASAEYAGTDTHTGTYTARTEPREPNAPKGPDSIGPLVTAIVAGLTGPGIVGPSRWRARRQFGATSELRSLLSPSLLRSRWATYRTWRRAFCGLPAMRWVAVSG